MSENNYGALMMKSTLSASVDIDSVLLPGCYPVSSGNSTAPDPSGGILTVYSGPIKRRTFASDSLILVTSTYNPATLRWGEWFYPVTRVNLSSNGDLPGISLSGLQGSGSLFDLLGGWTCPEAWGVVANSSSDAHDNSLNFFRMFEYLRAKGGGVIYMDSRATYYVDYLNFVPSNVTIYACGATIKHINPRSIYGRGGLVVGSSYEWNYETVKAAYTSGNYPASTSNPAFTDPVLQQYLEFNPSFVQAENVHIHDLRMEAVFTDSTYWGGYSLNFANARHCRVHNLRAKGWTQALNVGSDTNLSTPSCFDVRAYNTIVEEPDLVRTYYSIGFISNSTECELDGWAQMKPMTDGTQNGSAVATNVVDRCYIRDGHVPNLGKTVSSEGVLLNNATNCVVEGIDIRNCTSVISTFYTLNAFSTENGRNTIRNITGEGTYIISLRAKNAVVESFNGVGSFTAELMLANNNASGNIVNKEPVSFYFGGTNLQSWFLANNKIKGWKRTYKYIRPATILLNDKSDTISWDYNKKVATKSGVDLDFLWEVPSNFKAIDDVRCFMRFNTSIDNNAANAGSSVKISLIQMRSFDGNINTTPYPAIENTRIAASGIEDTYLVAQVGSNPPGLIYMNNTDNGLENSWYISLKMTKNVANNYMKETRIAGYM